METLAERKPAGITGNALRNWGMFFMTLGVLGQSVLENRLLEMGQISMQQLLDRMQSSGSTMMYATLALLFQAAATCAVPIFAFLLVEGMTHTHDFFRYLLRVLGVGVLSELPYNLAVSGKLMDSSGRNPALALAVGLVMLYFMMHFQENSFRNVLIKILVAAAALAWGWMLRIEGNVQMVLILTVLWIFRQKPLYRNFAGATASIVCSAVSPFYLASPMGFLVIHFYNGKREEGENRIFAYLFYPVMLLAVGMIAKYIL